MKKHLLIVLLITSVAGFAQPGKKPASKEKAPTQKEIDAMMKEMQAAMDEMSPEDKKMMDSMGVKMPDIKSIKKNISGISDVQMKKAYEDENQVVSKRDAARIAAIPKTVTDSKMGAYIAGIQDQLASVLKPAVVSTGNKVYDYIKTKSKNTDEAGNISMGLWLAGQPKLAIFVLGKLCATDAGNSDNLSNYSAMLSMLGAQQLAIPILNNLNAKYPKNSTLLNNLGQAWFGLGEISKAEKYLDSAIRIYAYHPQANLTKSLIEESKGNIPAAIAAAKKAIKNAYSDEKENRLKKLGYDLKPDDINWDQPKPQDVLGLSKFTWPEYPVDVDQSKILEEEWEKFRDECREKISELSVKRTTLEEEMMAANERRTKLLLSAQKGNHVQLIPGYAAKAIKKLGPGVEDINGNMSFVFSNEMEAIAKADLQAADYEDILEQKQEQLNKKYEDKIGEGKENPFEAVCKDENAIRTEFLNDANLTLKSAYQNYLNYVSRRTSDLLYYYQYTLWPDQFEVAKVNAQIAWLTQIKDQDVRFKARSSWCDYPPKTMKSGTLQNFDDVACKYKSKLNLLIFTIENNCSRMISKFDFMFLKYSRMDDFERAEGDEYISSTVTISAEVGKDIKAGPLKVEAKLGAGIELEMDRSGIKDVTLITEAKVGAGTNIFDENAQTGSPGIGILGKDAFPTTVEAGVEGRISLVSGHGSVSGTGLLNSIKMAEW